MPAIFPRQDHKSSASIPELLFTISVFLLLALTVGFILYKSIQRFRCRNQASREWTSTRSWDLSPLRPRARLEPAIVGVWMSNDVDPKFIHRIPYTESIQASLSRLVDQEGYIYVIAEPIGNFGDEKLDLHVQPAGPVAAG
ncbi:hypothetical protein FA15DRAFT_666112 [Coprinopsis marcescibilis]|uniref:Uncharacterized protein n=1 Tax=Coprinopsis marcescibilis TaxID=230819 RepID=A0A5C3L4D7_COPMA|nr:hypothetical protein FA15DRAFT_666112 [Coprinopsis marcescibilis]